ncbi:unnamed protein product [Lymnaea stagnalis]|uniref:Uncharacterized protein n=1 Tax=Lymnaea stagnalis TaxID=6523 RepID=A0AAV2I6T7_LYMST
MPSNAVVFLGCMALSFISGVSADDHTVEVVENCQAAIDKCSKIATTDDEIVKKQDEIATCFSSFICKDSNDESRMKTLLAYGVRIANAESLNLALTISVFYTPLILSTVTAFVLA